jgi:hypothetical protein
MLKKASEITLEPKKKTFPKNFELSVKFRGVQSKPDWRYKPKDLLSIDILALSSSTNRKGRTLLSYFSSIVLGSFGTVVSFPENNVSCNSKVLVVQQLHVYIYHYYVYCTYIFLKLNTKKRLRQTHIQPVQQKLG